jgi:hypothetical protein
MNMDVFYRIFVKFQTNLSKVHEFWTPGPRILNEFIDPF